MVFQQAIGIRLRHGLNVLGVEQQKVAVVALFHKDVLAVGAAIVDVIKHTWMEWRWAGHGRPFADYQTLRVSETLRVFVYEKYSTHHSENQEDSHMRMGEP